VFEIFFFGCGIVPTPREKFSNLILRKVHSDHLEKRFFFLSVYSPRKCPSLTLKKERSNKKKRNKSFSPMDSAVTTYGALLFQLDATEYRVMRGVLFVFYFVLFLCAQHQPTCVIELKNKKKKPQ
jgi:hypothetical protein